MYDPIPTLNSSEEEEPLSQERFEDRGNAEEAASTVTLIDADGFVIFTKGQRPSTDVGIATGEEYDPSWEPK
jgi:hypothetical protein